MSINYGSKDVGACLVGGRQILGSITQLEVDRTAEVARETPVGVAAATYVATGDKSASIAQSGFFDASADGSNNALCEKEGTSQVLCLLNEGNVAGRRAVCAQGAFAGAYKRLASRGSRHKAQATYSASGVVEDGAILQPLATVTTAGNTEGSSVDNGAATANGGAGYVQVPALTLGGYTDWTVKVRHSTNNATFVDLLSFEALTA